MYNISKISGFLILCSLLYVCKSMARSTDTLKQAYPTLLVTPLQVKQIRGSIPNNIAKKQSWLILKGAADKLLNEKLDIPQRGGTWEQFYISPATQHRLSRGKIIGDYEWEHVDPLTKKIYLGDTSRPDQDYNGVFISIIHDHWAMGALQLGLVYQILRKKEYAERAKEIILAYADLYPRLKIQSRKTETLTGVGYGKIHMQDLNEAQWLINMVQAADLIWGSFSHAEQQQIQQQLFVPAVGILRMKKRELSNIHCWKIAAIGLVGFRFGINEFINTAITDTVGGFNTHLRKAFSKEGFNIDQSPGYQFYFLQPLCLLAMAAQNNAYPIDISPMQRLFEMPLALATPSYMIPAFNDSRMVNLRGYGHLYEWAYNQFPKPAIAAMLNKTSRGYYKNTNAYYNGWYLLFGTESFPAAEPVAPVNRIFEKSGLLVLTQGEGADNLSCISKFSRQLGKRVHLQNAQLDFGLFKGDKQVVVVPGNVNYWADKSNNWYRSSLAHNTMVVNEQNQLRSFGECLDWGKKEGVSYALLKTSNVYDSMQFYRTLALMDENTLLVIDQFYSEKETVPTVDIACHLTGEWNNSAKGKKILQSDSAGYKYLTDAKINLLDKQLALFSKQKTGETYTTTILTDKPGQYIIGYGESSEDDHVPVVIVRRQAKKGIIINCISINGETADMKLNTRPNGITQLVFKNSSGKAVEITTDINEGTQKEQIFMIKRY